MCEVIIICVRLCNKNSMSFNMMNIMTGHRRRRLTQPNMETCSIENLPDELIELIILKCDVKSVIRFKSVSKSWQSIISNPRFMETLQSKLRSENHNKFFCWVEDEDYDEEGNNNRLYLVSLEEGGEFRREEVLGYPSPELVPVSYSNGLILLGKAPNEYVLWNPLIKKHITIPTFEPKAHPPAFTDWPYNDYRIDHHFFYDSATLDYKIVFFYLPSYYTVYSCKNRSWAEIKDFPHNLEKLYITTAEFWINGCLYTHSITKQDEDEDEDEDEEKIIYFDARDGKMHNLEVPSEVKAEDPFLEMEGVSGRLSVYFFDEDEKSLKLWVMEEDSDGSKRWKKVISMEIADPRLWDLAPTCLSDGDDFVLWAEVPLYDDDVRSNKYPPHFVYHHHSGTCSFKETDFTWEYCTKYFPYKESLYLPQ